jgi:hypothetical protein
LNVLDDSLSGLRSPSPMADNEVNPLLTRADAAINEAKRLQAEMDRTIATAEFHAHRMEQTFLNVRTMISPSTGPNLKP